MDETYTTTLNVTANQSTVKEPDVIALLDADETVFYHSIRSELDLLQQQPKQQIIDNILNYSRNRR